VANAARRQSLCSLRKKRMTIGRRHAVPKRRINAAGRDRIVSRLRELERDTAR
jgi:hypothetical protein